MSDGTGAPQTPNTPGGQPPQPFGVPQQGGNQPGAGSPPPFQQPQWPPVHHMLPQPAEPDWQLLAQQHEERAKRRRLLIGVGVGAGVLVLGGGAVAAVLLTRGGDPAPTSTASASASPGKGSPSPAPVSSAPLKPAVSANQLFGKAAFDLGGHNYVRKTVITDIPCWKASAFGLGDVLTANNCSQVMRATYFSGSTAITVGVAVFKSEAEARKTENAFKGQIQSLDGKDGVNKFCRNVACPTTHAVTGRYVYLTVAGPLNGSAGDQNPIARTAGQELATYFGEALAKDAGADKG
ncbi:hypothetical protein KNE206_22380 [Kitasatospora sp. NE20-6]